jgi:hypothetical protein
MRQGVVILFDRDKHGETKSAFTAENYSRLVQAKRAWDPDNFFRLNHNISPF